MRLFQGSESTLFGADRANLSLQCAKLRFSGDKGLAGAGEGGRVLILHGFKHIDALATFLMRRTRGLYVMLQCLRFAFKPGEA